MSSLSDSTTIGSMSPAPGTPTKNSPVVSKSPNCKVISDRFIPLRDHNNWQNKLALAFESKLMLTKEEGSCIDGNYSRVLRNEILQFDIPEDIGKNMRSPEKLKLFQYMSPTKNNNTLDAPSSELYSLSPLSNTSRKILQSPSKQSRKISHIPIKVLDAPELQDDFYLNLVDWSSQNMLTVGLGSSVYLWSADTSQVTRLCELQPAGNLVTSVCWNNKGNLISIGTHFGSIHIWDVPTLKKVTVLPGHSSRVSSLAWTGNMLASGSRDRLIILHDLRMPGQTTNTSKNLIAHRQEVCGLKWSPDGRYLASGGNDNRVYIWNLHSTTPVQCYTEHTAAVKAIAWSPHHHGLLATGGGTADRCIRFWNTVTGQQVNVLDTGSQVCNIAWSKNSSELVSTHGYTQNEICIWSYPSLSQVAKLIGHSLRVLYLAMSPSGETIVTGAGDETLRFWNVFRKVQSKKEKKSALNLFTNIR